jgi:general stress protein 26
MSDLQQRIFDASKELQLMNFATITEDGKPWVRYVVGKADNDLVFRFCTHLNTKKVSQVRQNPNVHISMGATDMKTAAHWMQVEGTAEISTDKTQRQSFWFEALENYFTGPDDPQYCVVIIRPSRIEFGTTGSMTPEVWNPGVI